MVMFDTLVSLAKRRGFVFPGSDIYGGLAGTWDLGPLGAELAHNIKNLWWDHFVKKHPENYGLASSILMPEAVWSASGHLDGFSDPMEECKKCKKRWQGQWPPTRTRFICGRKLPKACLYISKMCSTPCGRRCRLASRKSARRFATKSRHAISCFARASLT